MYFWMYVFCFDGGILIYIKMFDNYHVLANIFNSINAVSIKYFLLCCTYSDSSVAVTRNSNGHLEWCIYLNTNQNTTQRDTTFESQTHKKNPS